VSLNSKFAERPGSQTPQLGPEFLYVAKTMIVDIYDPDECPAYCSGATRDCYGDPAFSCLQNSKKMASNFTQPTLATTLNFLHVNCDVIGRK